MYSKILFACLLSLSAINFSSCNKQEIEQGILQDLLNSRSYDKRIRPPGSNQKGPTIVHVNLYIRDIEYIDDAKREFAVQLTFRQQWQDKRLSFNNRSSTNLRYLIVTDVSQVWKPNLFFANDKSAHVHDMMVPNEFMRIYPSGELLYSSRISLKLSCPMNYKNFPFDDHTCFIRMASYGYTNEDILFQWKSTSEPVQIIPDLDIPDFKFNSYATELCDSNTTTGTYSCLTLNLNFSRDLSPYLVNVYIPCTMVVILAWLGTFLDRRSETGRLLVSVASLYTLATLCSQLNTTFPRVNYTKAIDIWTGTSVTFIFSTVAEFILISYLARLEDGSSNKVNCIGEETEDHRKFSVQNWLADYSSKAERLDTVFRILYPITFIIFACLYMIVY